MTTTEREILTALLDVLHERDGGTIAEALLYGAVASRWACSLRDFERVLQLAAERGWVTGVTDQFKRRRWAILPDGEAARSQL